MLSKEKLAKQLAGIAYPVGLNMPKDLVDEAVENDLVVIYGASDDNICMQGAVYDEVGAYDGGEIFLDGHGLVPPRDMCDDDDEMLEDHFKRMGSAKKVEGIFDSNGYVWRFETGVPHATFETDGEDEKWQCLVVDLKDLR